MPEWLWMVAVGVATALAGIIWRAHEKRDDERFRDVRKHIDERIESILDQIGRDGQSGMRKSLHDAYNRSLGNRELIRRLEQRFKDKSNER